MQFKLQKSGTVTECREALNEAVHSLPTPEIQEHKVIRAIANAVVVDYLDPKHTKWQEKVQKERGAQLDETPEPAASISIDCTISYGAK